MTEDQTLDVEIRWTPQYLAVRAILNIVKISFLAAASTYLPVMDMAQRGMFFAGIAAALGDGWTNDYSQVRRIHFDGDHLRFISWRRTRVHPASDLGAIVHPWYDISRVWVRWRFAGDTALTTTIHFRGLVALTVLLHERVPGLDLRL